MPSTEINTTSYDAVASDYTSAAIGIQGLSQHYYDAAYEILILSVFDPELDLLAPFYNAYLASSGTYTNIPIAGISAVGELQRHILNRARDSSDTRYTNINTWMTDHSVTVSQEFADISEMAGFVIDPGNIV